MNEFTKKLTLQPIKNQNMIRHNNNKLPDDLNYYNFVLDTSVNENPVDISNIDIPLLQIIMKI